MSFISILRTIGSTVLGVEHVAAPIAETLFPQFSGGIAILDGIFQHLQKSIVNNEISNPVDGQGGLKLPAVTADFETGLAVTQDILKVSGKKLTYDAAALKEAIDAQVVAFNAMAKVKASFKVENL